MSNKKDNYLFFKKIKPDEYLWCTSMQTRVKFEDEAWIGVVSEHTTFATGDHKVFYGNIFTNSTAWGVYLTSKDIEFEVWEDSSTEGERIKKQEDIPSRCQRLLYMDFPYAGNIVEKSLVSLVDSIKTKKF